MRLVFYSSLLILICLFSCKNISRNKSVKQKSETPLWATKKYTYKPSQTLKQDLLHTKLEVSFDWDKKQLLGKATLTFKPYFYSQDSLILDAKEFDVNAIKLIGKDNVLKDLLYTYDKNFIRIALDKQYNRNEKFTVLIDYTANPERIKERESVAIHSNKGLFFITPDTNNPEKPYQVWTQGETESSSCWFPTIDVPNEKTTSEIFITVEEKYKTLSNGELINSTNNKNGTRTDYWKQSLPHSPYLFMMAIGEFSIVKDKWNGLEVNYYVEPAYEKYAKDIFGNTPDMIEFFSKKLNYKFPWAKYSSVVVRDYVSGAMENTSATVFMEGLQKTKRELIDKNWDNIISHELFHHWFGDLVTCESWANLPLNESFATYAEYLWEEHKRGNDEAEYARQGDLKSYLGESDRKREPMIRYYHRAPDDMFDSHSYAKGGCILHMLRKYTGDEAFFESLNLYLKRNEFKNAEIHHLRLAFEEVTGEDLNWFFNQWFLSAGHPELVISDTYENNTVKVKIFQVQDTLYAPVYKLPTQIDIWVKGKKQSHTIIITKKAEEFSFKTDEKPELVIFDPEQIIVGEINHKKNIFELVKQYEYSDSYMAKYDALDILYSYSDSVNVRSAMIKAIKDPFWKIREIALNSLSRYKGKDTVDIFPVIKEIALEEKNSTVRSAAINNLSRKKRTRFEDVYLKGMSDSSYLVAGTSLLAYLRLEPKDADEKLKLFENEKNGDIIESLSEYYATHYDSTKHEWFVKHIKAAQPESLYYLIQNYGRFLIKSSIKQQNEGVKILVPLAENNHFDWIRYCAYQALGLMDIDAIEPIRKRIRENEKSERLKNLYKSLP